MLNELGRHKASEEQILHRIEEGTDRVFLPYWIAELAEARLNRLRESNGSNEKNGVDVGVDVEESVAYFDWARGAFEAALGTTESLERWQATMAYRQLWVLLTYAELVRLGALEPEAALPPPRRGYELSMAWMEGGYAQNGLRPWDFALAEFKLELLRKPLDPGRLEVNFERLADLGGDADRLTQERLRLLIELHGEGTLQFARELESWVARYGVHGPNALVAVLYAARAYLGLEMYDDVLRLLEPYLTYEPDWVGDRFRSAYMQMQIQNALAYIAAADALEDDRARRNGVENLLAYDRTVNGESDAVDKARRYAALQLAAEQRQH